MEDERKQVDGTSDEQSGSAHDHPETTSVQEAPQTVSITPVQPVPESAPISEPPASPADTVGLPEPFADAEHSATPAVAEVSAAAPADSGSPPEAHEAAESTMAEAPAPDAAPASDAALADVAPSPAEATAVKPPAPPKKEPLSAEVIAKWKELQEALHQKKTVEMRVLRKIKGGTILDFKGLDVFMPYSHWHIGPESGDAEIDKLLGHPLMVRVIEVSSPEKGRVVASRRKILMEERCAQLKDGQELKGRISGVTSFGVFVDIGGVEGLIHISQLMSRRGMSAAEHLKVGDEVDVSIFRIDQKRGRVWLNLRGFLAGAWKEVPEKYPVESVHKGKVVDIKKYGVFVELEPGIEAFLHAQEMSWTARVKDPGDVMKVGDDIELKVLKVKETAQKIEVSLKQTTENPWDALAITYRKGTVCEGKVKEVLEKGVVIALPDHVDGFLPKSKMTPRGGGDPLPDPAVGDSMQLRVVDVSSEKQYIILGTHTPRPDRPRDDRPRDDRRPRQDRGGFDRDRGRDRDRDRGGSGMPVGHQPTLGELISEKIRRKLFPGRS
jgi:ribosomal protein S1